MFILFNFLFSNIDIHHLIVYKTELLCLSLNSITSTWHFYTSTKVILWITVFGKTKCNIPPLHCDILKSLTFLHLTAKVSSRKFTYIFPCIPCNNSIHVTHEETAAGGEDGVGRARTWLRWACHCLTGSLSPSPFSSPLPYSCSVMLALLLRLLCVKSISNSSDFSCNWEKP